MAHILIEGISCQTEVREQPSKKGGKAAEKSSISAATIAKALSGIEFPDSLMQYVHNHISKLEIKDSRTILNILDQIAGREYNDMSEIEQEIGRIK